MKTNLLPCLLTGALAGFVLLPVARAQHEHMTMPSEQAALGDLSLYQVASTWTDDAGAERTLATLRGGPVVVAMIYTSCQNACPLMVADMMKVKLALPEAVREQTRFLLVSFDPDRDTVPALHAYRERLGLDDTWTLLRGAPGDVRELAMLLGVKYQRDAAGDYAHSNLLTVLNPEGEIAYQREGLNEDPARVVAAVVGTVEGKD